MIRSNIDIVPEPAVGLSVIVVGLIMVVLSVAVPVLFVFLSIVVPRLIVVLPGSGTVMVFLLRGGSGVGGGVGGGLILIPGTLTGGLEPESLVP